MNWNLDILTCPPAGQTGVPEKERRWFTVAGIAAIILGLVTIVIPLMSTMSIAIMAFGAVLLINGLIHGFRTLQGERGGREFLPRLAIGILYVLAGLLMVFSPAMTLLSLAVLTAAFLIVTGGLRIFAAVTHRVPNTGWILFNGVLGVILGLAIWVSWPLSGLWLIGLFLAIELLVSGWSTLVMGFEQRDALGRVCTAGGTEI